jgi:hypothetical protein
LAVKYKISLWWFIHFTLSLPSHSFGTQIQWEWSSWSSSTKLWSLCFQRLRRTLCL